MTGLLGRGLASNPLGAGTEGTLGSFTGWHGTPHDFHQFSDEAIGSGEGAQAYGWGHYVAGKKGVAEYYRDSLANNDVHFVYDGQPFHSDQINEFPETAVTPLAAMLDSGFDPEAARKSLVRDLDAPYSLNKQTTDKDIVNGLKNRGLPTDASSIQAKRNELIEEEESEKEEA